jgi:hypothetical protein
MTIDRARTPDTQDPLLTAILEEAALVKEEEVDPDLEDPALLELVERAVAPFAAVLTAAGLDAARDEATFTLATHPDIEAALERVRSGAAQEPSGVRTKRTPAQLAEVARRRRAGRGGA